MLITNKYENNCTKCSRIIPIDEQVEWKKGTGIAHVKCPSKIGELRSYSYKKVRLLKKCQQCKTDVTKGDKYIYESNRLCKKCWEGNLSE